VSSTTTPPPAGVRPVTSIHLTPAERQDLLDHYRRSADPDVGHRAHILQPLADGHAWATIGAVLYCSSSTISWWQARFESGGVDAVFGRPRGRTRSGVHVWAALVVRWVLTLSRTDSRFARSRWIAGRGPWCCGTTFG
jgi:Helix-turn-helix domain